MAATKCLPRTATAQRTPRTDRKKVEDLLRELAFVLHCTRKINQEIDWPIVVDKK